jgi:hypothetical protein
MNLKEKRDIQAQLIWKDILILQQDEYIQHVMIT